MLNTRTALRQVFAPAVLTQQWLSAWTNYAAGQVSPLRLWQDAAAFWSVIGSPEPPSFAHDNTVIAQWPIARLRDFTVPEPTSEYPTLVIPARSGMTSAGVDLSLDASLVGTLLANGHDRTYSLDWTDADADTATAGIEDHITVVREAIDRLGSRVHLVGYSQGGWLAAMVAALDPDTVTGLTVGAAPIDTHVGAGVATKVSYRALGVLGGAAEALDRHGWVHPGLVQSGMLRTAEWQVEATRTAQLWGGVHDESKRRRHAAVRRWLNTPQDLPGPFVRWSVTELFGANHLVHGRVVIAGEPVDLARIDCPLHLIAGERDEICPADQVWALADVVSTPADAIHRVSAPVGHLDLLFDPAILRDYWAPLLAASGSGGSLAARKAR